MTGLEVALFGQVAVAGTSSAALAAGGFISAAVAPTAGLIGFGGAAFASGATLGFGALGTAFQVGAGLFSAVSSVQQGGFQAGIARNQAIERQQLATQKRQIAAVNARSQERANVQAFKTRRALLGGANVELNSGTPLLVSVDIAGRFKEEEEKIRFQGRQDALAEESRAKIYAAQSASYKRAGYDRAGAALLATGAKVFA
jgi:hypothetical protein